MADDEDREGKKVSGTPDATEKPSEKHKKPPRKRPHDEGTVEPEPETESEGEREPAVEVQAEAKVEAEPKPAPEPGEAKARSLADILRFERRGGKSRR